MKVKPSLGPILLCTKLDVGVVVLNPARLGGFLGGRRYAAARA
jgi:hypothetical protein